MADHREGHRGGDGRVRRPALRPLQERLLVWVTTGRQGGPEEGALSERDFAPGVLGCDCGHDLGPREPRGGTGGVRRDGFRALSEGAGALYFPASRALHRLEPAEEPEE